MGDVAREVLSDEEWLRLWRPDNREKTEDMIKHLWSNVPGVDLEEVLERYRNKKP